ncbi:MAG: response regulator [Deltaproteobacteria bacterium]|nr:response regulator [Deltaproteobacteria bacterium]
MGTDAFQTNLWNSNEQLEVILSNLPTGIFIIDSDTLEILEVNETVLRMTHWTRDAIIGRSCKDILCGAPDGSCPAREMSMDRLISECQMKLNDDTVIPTVKTIAPVELNGRKCFLESVLDITEQKKVENRLRKERERVERLAQEAQEANKAKSEFLANISHELRTPLNGVLGMASLLKETELTEDQECYADTMHVCAESLLKLVNGVLDYSNLEAGQIELSKRAFSPGHLLQSVAEQVKGPATQKNLNLKIDADKDMSTRVKGDSSRLQQVLMILTDNALKFTDSGEIDIGLHTQPIDNHNLLLQFVVRDTGIGIPEDKLDFIFERFTQVDSSTTRKHGGTGLGLATAKEIIRLMGGHIGVRNIESGGAEFTVKVPLPLVEKKQSAPKTRQKPKSVLVVDDSKTNRDVMVSMLNKLGYQCATASGGENAVEVLSTRNFDLIFMDIQMPDVDGLVVSRAIRAGMAGADAEDVPIIALSASPMPDESQWRQVGIHHCVAKPVSLDELQTLLNEWCPVEGPTVTDKNNSTTVAIPTRKTTPVFDRGKLLSRLMGDAGILQTVLAGFIDDIPTQIDKLAQLVEAGSLEQARIRTHGIKGASATVCAEKMSAHCARMEQQAELGDSSALALGLIELRTLFNELKEETSLGPPGM